MEDDKVGLTADQVRAGAKSIQEAEKEGRLYMGDEEVEYIKMVCACIMAQIGLRASQGHVRGTVKYRIITDVDSEKVQYFPDWLKHRGETARQLFTGLGYDVHVEYNAERHGFGDWSRWFGVDIQVSW